MNKIIQGNCLEELKLLEENSIDSIVTDPPYELGFMGKSWDNTGIANNPVMWAECLRVLKPGGYLLSFGGTRTYHRMACAIEDAGFEVRDQMVWCYGQGFPKSLNISLQIKKKYNIGLCTCNVFEPMIELDYENTNTTNNKGNGDYVGQGLSDEARVERGSDKKTQSETGDKIISGKSGLWNADGEVCELRETDTEKKQGLEKVGEVVLQQGVPQPINEKEGYGDIKIRSGVESNQTESQRERRDLQMLRKERQEQSTSSPLDTIQNGREEHNGESSESLSELSQQDRENNRKRIEQIKNDCGTEEWSNLSRFVCSKCYCIKKDIGGTALKPSIEPICMARKPLAEKTVAENVLKYGTGGINIDASRVTTEYYLQGRFPANLLHDNSEEVKECFPDNIKGEIGRAGRKFGGNYDASSYKVGVVTETGFKDNGSASRFFKSIIYQAKASKSERNKGCEELSNKEVHRYGAGLGEGLTPEAPSIDKNNHPTVKPIALMEYLIKMVTPKGGIVLDPFAGSGSTLVAAKQNGFQYIGIEMTAEYIPIIEARLK